MFWIVLFVWWSWFWVDVLEVSNWMFFDVNVVVVWVEILLVFVGISLVIDVSVVELVVMLCRVCMV